MSNIVDRSNPGALGADAGTAFRNNLNNRLAALFRHAVDLDANCEIIADEFIGNGTLPSNTVELILDAETPGVVTCPVGYRTLIGVAVVSTAPISQAYTQGTMNYVFLHLDSAGVLSLVVKLTNQALVNEILVASIDAAGIINNNPPGKPLARIHNLGAQSVGLGDASNRSIAGTLDARYVKVITNSTAGEENIIPHGLGRVPAGYIVVGIDKPGVVYNGETSWDDINIFLRCSEADTELALMVW